MNITIPKYDMNFIETISIGTGTSLAIDFTTNKLHEISINANATLTVTGLAIGETGLIFVSNTHSTTDASVALPDVKTETNSANVPALTTVRITVIRLTSTYAITWSGALS